MATIKDIAKHTGLGLATVSKYINGGTVKEKNKIAIEQAIDTFGYTVNHTARSLRSGKSMSIGVILPQIKEVFRTTILSRVEELLRINGYSLIFVDSKLSPRREKEAVEFVISKQVDGIINIPVAFNKDHLMPVVEKNIPLVLIDFTLPGLEDYASAVVVDNINAAKMATEHLIKAGHTHIAILLGTDDARMDLERLEGYKQAHAEHGIKIQQELIKFTDYTIKQAYERSKELLTILKPTALFSANYYATMGAIMAIQSMNIQMPKDLAYIGFDKTPLTDVFSPPITYIEQPLEEIAMQVANIMLEKLTTENVKPKTVTLSTKIHPGETV